MSSETPRQRRITVGYDRENGIDYIQLDNVPGIDPDDKVRIAFADFPEIAEAALALIEEIAEQDAERSRG